MFPCFLLFQDEPCTWKGKRIYEKWAVYDVPGAPRGRRHERRPVFVLIIWRTDHDLNKDCMAVCVVSWSHRDRHKRSITISLMMLAFAHSCIECLLYKKSLAARLKLKLLLLSKQWHVYSLLQSWKQMSLWNYPLEYYKRCSPGKVSCTSKHLVAEKGCPWYLLFNRTRSIWPKHGNRRNK